STAGPGLHCGGFSYHDPAPAYVSTLSLHDALPIFERRVFVHLAKLWLAVEQRVGMYDGTQIEFSLLGGLAFQRSQQINPANQLRSEEHTSELQSREKLVCRLLLEKKKYYMFDIYRI